MYSLDQVIWFLEQRNMERLPKGAKIMYSLDQVIWFLEQRQQTEDWNIRDEAITYLKGYKEILPEYCQMKLDAVNNPLTWEELLEIKGKPVWVEVLDDTGDHCKWRGEWMLVKDFSQGIIGEYCHMEPNYRTWIHTSYGDLWRAYRRERADGEA